MAQNVFALISFRFCTYTECVSTTEQSTASDATEPRLPWYARPLGTASMLLVTAVVGLIATSILVLERVELWNDPDYVTSCDINPWVSCGEVMQSWQATLFGFPNQFIGLVAFPIVITVAMALFARAHFSRWFWAVMNVGVVLGLIFCVWLWSQAVYSIGVLCLYCMVVWAMMIPMTVLLTVRNMFHGAIPVSPQFARSAANWAWPVILLLYVGVAASVILQFSAVLF